MTEASLSLYYHPEFDNFGAVMSVSEDLLCAFELLKPLDGPALRKEMTKAKRKRYVDVIFAKTFIRLTLPLV